MVFAKTTKYKENDMSHHKHLTLLEREMIFLFFNLGFSISLIASLMMRNKSTISRELKRNSENGRYIPSVAENKYHNRRRNCKPKYKLDDPELFELVRDKFLNHQWSPEEIAGRLKMEESKFSISHNTIYRGIYAGMFDAPEQRRSHGNKGARRKLRHRGKSRHTKDYVERRGKIRISNHIADRPEEANNRTRIGDWEADTVSCKEGKACLVTLTDRLSRFLICEKVPSKKASYVSVAIIKALHNQPVYSITPDRGKEFAWHADVTAALGDVPFYFPLPHHPWQRGTNENTNGLLREYFPRGIDITDMPDEVFSKYIHELNCRPRKCLGYQTPYEVYHSTLLQLI